MWKRGAGGSTRREKTLYKPGYRKPTHIRHNGVERRITFDCRTLTFGQIDRLAGVRAGRGHPSIFDEWRFF
jgi:hypothetical protein